jgi:hypothetical protein
MSNGTNDTDRADQPDDTGRSDQDLSDLIDEIMAQQPRQQATTPAVTTPADRAPADPAPAPAPTTPAQTTPISSGVGGGEVSENVLDRALQNIPGMGPVARPEVPEIQYGKSPDDVILTQPSTINTIRTLLSETSPNERAPTRSPRDAAMIERMAIRPPFESVRTALAEMDQEAPNFSGGQAESLQQLHQLRGQMRVYQALGKALKRSPAGSSASELQLRESLPQVRAELARQMRQIYDETQPDLGVGVQPERTQSLGQHAQESRITQAQEQLRPSAPTRTQQAAPATSATPASGASGIPSGIPANATRYGRDRATTGPYAGATYWKDPNGQMYVVQEGQTSGAPANNVDDKNLHLFRG